uniref:Uncharacterized protein n=1 Tax=Kalanchoe fedtschenkoi TaxID=63787 RepID=A0A7N0VC51_KALFE
MKIEGLLTDNNLEDGHLPTSVLPELKQVTVKFAPGAHMPCNHHLQARRRSLGWF